MHIQLFTRVFISKNELYLIHQQEFPSFGYRAIYLPQFIYIIFLKTLWYLSKLKDLLGIAFGGAVIEVYFINNNGKL